MTLDDTQLIELCSRTLHATGFSELEEKKVGKVRETHLRNDQRLTVVSDRVSAFDLALGTIPFKKEILNQMTAFWSRKRTEEI